MSLRPITLTHARLRAAQGDAATARRICRALLELEPGQSEVLALLGRLDRPLEARPEPRRRRVDPRALKKQFSRLVGGSPRPEPRIERLERWLAAIRRGSA